MNDQRDGYTFLNIASPRARAVYLDYAATTPVDPRVAHRMSKCLMFEGDFGNPASSSHVFGWEAEEHVENARVQLATLIGADPLEIVWTSGATESDNLALKGLTEQFPTGHIVTSSYEHKAVLDTCAYLEDQGYRVTYVEPESNGVVSKDAVESAMEEDTFVVSIMHVNNEIGIVNDIAEIGRLCRDKKVFFHVDAAQSVGKVPVNVSDMHVDMLSISGHKIYGPKGIGALYVRRAGMIPLRAIIHGGGHERGMRSGTLATHQIVGIGAAAEICGQELDRESQRLRELRNRLWAHLRQIPDVYLNGSEDQRIPGLINVGFGDVDGETMLMALNDVAVSSGSACTSATVEPSYVLRAIGVPDELASASLRFTVGRFTTEEEIDFAATRIADVVHALRERRVED